VVGDPTAERPGGGGGDDVDGGGGGGGDGGGGGGGDGGANVACEPAATQLPNGEHNPGTACLACHNGTLGPLFTLAGTVFTAADGATPVAGGTVILRDAANVEIKLITAQNGNFYTTQAFQAPLTVSASKCPDTKAMMAAAEVGECNSCHQPGMAGRIHLP
jgi:hypothetical protein